MTEIKYEKYAKPAFADVMGEFSSFAAWPEFEDKKYGAGLFYGVLNCLITPLYQVTEDDS